MAGLEKIIAKLEQVADNIVNLRVITAVGDFEIVEQDGQLHTQQEMVFRPT